MCLKFFLKLARKLKTLVYLTIKLKIYQQMNNKISKLIYNKAKFNKY